MDTTTQSTTAASIAEGELVLHLYDLRRETEMRKARNWFAEFWPQNFSEMEQIMGNFSSQHSHWLRQVLSYWDMAAALVLRGSLSQELFLDTCGEAWFCYAKVKPFIQESRTKFSPEFLSRLEKACEGSPEGRERVERMQEMFKNFAAAAAQKQGQSQSNQAA